MARINTCSMQRGQTIERVARDALWEMLSCARYLNLNREIIQLFNCNFHPIDVVPRWRDPQLQVSANYSDLTQLRSTILKSYSIIRFRLKKCLDWKIRLQIIPKALWPLSIRYPTESAIWIMKDWSIVIVIPCGYSVPHYISDIGIEGCISHSTKWNIHPFYPNDYCVSVQKAMHFN